MKQITVFILALSFSLTAFSQLKITGIVSDTIDVLPGANIIVKGTRTGTTTNLDGFFELEVKKNDTLSISYLGYATKDVIIKNQKSIQAVLEIDNAIDEVVVLALGLKRCEKMIACYCGAFSSCYTVVEDMYVEKKVQGNPVKLYPNPSSVGYFNLKFLKNYKKVKIQVANMSGQIIQSKIFQNVNNVERLDLSKYASGIYILNIIADDERLPIKKAIIG